MYYLDVNGTKSYNLLILGDFNFHFESPTDPSVTKLREILDSLDLQQHVEHPTHDNHHMLDLVISRQDEQLISELLVCPFYLSDHCFITFNIVFGKPPSSKKVIRSRKIKEINLNDFIQDLENSNLVKAPPECLDELEVCYNTTLRQVLDKHAPEKTKEIILRPQAPWYTDCVRKAKQERRQAERRWKKTQLHVDKGILKEKQKQANDLCDKAKTDFYSSKINDAKENSKELFNLANTLLSKQKDSSLPTHSDSKVLANDFGLFFKQKIDKIRLPFSDFSNVDGGTDKAPPDTPGCSSFNEISREDISKIIEHGNSKSCSLDPVPTSLLKSILPVILPSLHQIINLSLQKSRMPQLLKDAIVTPLLKKSSLNKENFKNYRPVSNLPYLGKIIEKAAITQIETHLSQKSLHEPLQSAYTAHHSTETALVKVSNDILLSLDRGICVYLVLLDLSAAFDTIDHSVFIQRLTEDYGISGSVTDWMKSYLTNRHQQITINGQLSDEIKLDYGFPQGSCIGPFGFKLYTKPLTKIAQYHQISIHLYADDTQLYVEFDPEDSESALSRLEGCIEDIRVWMKQNFLKLNEDKTEFIIFGTKRNIEKVTAWSVSVGDSEILPSTAARNIGAYMDSELNMNTHINSVIKSCYFQLRHLAKIRKYLTIDATQKLTHAFISSRLDNLNALLYNLPDYLLSRLQKVQNHAARLVLRQKKSCHISPLLFELHWLPIEYRTQYKLLLIVFKCLMGKAPSYLSSLVQPYSPARSLRSCDQLLQPTRRKFGDRAFMIAGPKLWNSLPLCVQQRSSLGLFKTELKTYLFTLAF